MADQEPASAPATADGSLDSVPPAELPPAEPPAAEPPTVSYELPSAAPVVGAVRGLQPPCLALATRHRSAAVTLDGVQVGGWHVSAASIIGASHLVTGGVRQDAYDFVATKDGYLIIAIADGLGSRPFSQLGAALFCEGVTQAALAPERTPRAAGELLLLGAEYVATASQASYRTPLADVAFVAAVAVLRAAGPGHASTAEIARIGDVSAFAADPDEPLTELFATDDGPINVLTESLPAAAPPEPQTAQTRARMLALVTDGLANDLRTSPKVRAWLAERWTEPIGPFAFGDSLRYQRQGSHDDRTAVVTWHVGVAGEIT